MAELAHYEGMARPSVVVALASVVSVVSCTTLLGEFPSVGSGGDASSGSGGEGGATDATQGDSHLGDTGSTGDTGSSMDAMTESGMDASVCAAGAMRCSGNSVETCASGAWGTAVACPTADPYCGGAGVCGACVGVCQGQCTPGSTTCSPNGPQVCGTNGAWGTPTACGTNQTCTGGGAAGPATCTCAVNATCSAAGLACENATTLATCGQDSMGCWYASSTSACANGACFGAAPSAACCTNACTLGAYKCGGAGLQQCVAQGNGCTAWNAGTACGSHQSCTTTGGVGSCTCNVDPLCTSLADECASTTSYVTCAQDSNSCFYQASTASCTPNATCSGGTCSCSSGFTSCSGLCVDISTNNSNCGGCGNVCPVLTSPSSGSTCGIVSAGVCTGYVGGYVTTGGGTLNGNPSGQDVFVVKATMPAVAGTFEGVGGLFGSTDSSGTTQIIFGLYSDSAGKPNLNLFYTNDPDPTLSFNDPSGLVRLTSGGGSYLNGFNNVLAANTTYWAYMKAGTNGTNNDTVGISSAPCLGQPWINVQPEGTWNGGVACPGDFSVYLVVNFP